MDVEISSRGCANYSRKTALWKSTDITSEPGSLETLRIPEITPQVLSSVVHVSTFETSSSVFLKNLQRKVSLDIPNHVCKLVTNERAWLKLPVMFIKLRLATERKYFEHEFA